MDHSLLQELLMTKDPAEKAAIIAEYFFSALPEQTIRVARQCILFHWFDVPIIEALLQETSLTEDEKSEACKQLVSLPFIETLPWGYRFQNLTREGLLKRYVLAQPELLQKAAHLAAPAYKAREDDKRMAAEALFCYMVAGNQPLSIYLLDKLQEEASSQEDWYSLSNLLQLQEEAEQLPFVQPLPRTEQHWLLRGLVHRAQGKLEVAIADCSNAILINSESALAYVCRGTLYAEQQHDEQALVDYNLALRFDPTMAQAYINRGIIYTKQKRFSEALQDFKSALQLDPNNVFVYLTQSVQSDTNLLSEDQSSSESVSRIDPLRVTPLNADWYEKLCESVYRKTKKSR